MKSHTHLEGLQAIDYKVLKVLSPAFPANGVIPRDYTCQGRNINPPLKINLIPKPAKSLAILVIDVDAPSGKFCHWVIWNIPVTNQIVEQEQRGAQGMNDMNRHCYDGPCPPSGSHRYQFKVYALDCTLNIPVSSNATDFERAISDHIIGFGQLTGTYQTEPSTSDLL